MNKLSQNPTPLRNNKGSTINKTSEGSTNQKIPCDKAETCSISPVSRYNQIKARRDVRGKDANVAAKNELRLASSETATNTAAEKIIFRPYCHMGIGIPDFAIRRQFCVQNPPRASLARRQRYSPNGKRHSGRILGYSVYGGYPWTTPVKRPETFVRASAISGLSCPLCLNSS